MATSARPCCVTSVTVCNLTLGMQLPIILLSETRRPASLSTTATMLSESPLAPSSLLSGLSGSLSGPPESLPPFRVPVGLDQLFLRQFLRELASNGCWFLRFAVSHWGSSLSELLPLEVRGPRCSLWWSIGSDLASSPLSGVICDNKYRNRSREESSMAIDWHHA